MNKREDIFFCLYLINPKTIKPILKINHNKKAHLSMDNIGYFYLSAHKRVKYWGIRMKSWATVRYIHKKIYILSLRQSHINIRISRITHIKDTTISNAFITLNNLHLNKH